MSGKVLLIADFKNDDNKISAHLACSNKIQKHNHNGKVNDKPAEKYPFTLVPPKKWEIYFVQHSHTDIGYTRPQSEILAEQCAISIMHLIIATDRQYA